MPYSVVLTKRAMNSLWEAMDWYNQESPGLGMELMQEFFGRLKDLRENPQRFTPVFKPYRRLLLKRFPFKIVFAIDEKRNRVLVAVLWHVKRDPELLKSLLKK